MFLYLGSKFGSKLGSILGSKLGSKHFYMYKRIYNYPKFKFSPGKGNENLIDEIKKLAHDKGVSANAVMIEVITIGLKSLQEKDKREKSRAVRSDKGRIGSDKSPGIPSMSEFKQFILSNDSSIDLTLIELKYKSWVENEWRDGRNQPIKNWKSKVLNTIPYMRNNTQPNNKIKHDSDY